MIRSGRPEPTAQLYRGPTGGDGTTPGTHTGSFDAYAVTSRSGPHVTLQAGTVHAGRHWTTTTRRSVKVGVIRRLGWASVTMRAGGGHRLAAGSAVAIDLAHPMSLTRDPLASALAGGALLRLGLGRLDQLVGYAQVGISVPAAFSPVGRVLLATRISDQITLVGESVVSVRGRWARDPVDLTAGRGPSRPWRAGVSFGEIPGPAADLAHRAGPCWLGVQDDRGTVALPAAWDPRTGRVRVSRAALSTIGVELPGAVCVTLDDSESRRPDEKMGVMLRGTGTIVDFDQNAALIAVGVGEISYWSGFASSTKRLAA